MNKNYLFKLAVVLVGLSVLVPNTSSFAQTSTPPGVVQLQQVTGGEIEFTWNPATGTPSFIRGQIPAASLNLSDQVSPSTTATTFLNLYAGLFGIEDTTKELLLIQEDLDNMGIKHITFSQVYQGIEVYNAGVKIHLLVDNQDIVAVSNSFVPNISLPSVNPQINSEQALFAAQKALPDGILTANPQLVVYPGTGKMPGASAKLAWLVELWDDAIPARNVYVVDAIEDGILQVLDRLYINDNSPKAGAQPAHSISYAPNLTPNSPSNQEPAFCIPTNGFVGLIYDQGSHKGIDFWTMADGLGLSGSMGNPIFLPYSGVLTNFIFDNSIGASGSGPIQGFTFTHNNVPGYGTVETRYFHMADQDSTNTSYINTNLQLGQSYPKGTFLGYQGNRLYDNSGDVITHLHFVIVQPPGSNLAIDPSLLLGNDFSYPSSEFAPPSPYPSSPVPTQHVCSGRRKTYDANHTYSLPGTLKRSEGDGPTGDQDIDNAHDFAGATYDYYWNTFSRDSYDDQGASIISTAHYGTNYQNAFWNGEQMVYGDSFPVNDVVAHELTHAVTEHSANLEYQWQSGALNESFSDIFGAMVDRDDWLMGEDLPPEALGGREAIRDLADPPRFGQPDNTKDWVETCSDNEGVHTNSGITNKAYYNIATTISKEEAEHIFYRALTVYLQPTSSLEDARAAVLQAAQDSYGSGSTEYNAVVNGFNAVGLDGTWNPPTNDCTCAASLALSDSNVDKLSGLETIATLYRVRDQLMTSNIAGKHYGDLYQQYTGRISYLLLLNSSLKTEGASILQDVTPDLSQLLIGQDSESIVTQETVNNVITFVERLATEDRANGGGELAQTIESEMSRIDWEHLIGLTYGNAWEYIQAQFGVHSIYLPFVVR